jgi:hypothetical protein
MSETETPDPNPPDPYRAYLNIIYRPDGGGRARVNVNSVPAEELPEWYTGGREARTERVFTGPTYEEALQIAFSAVNTEPGLTELATELVMGTLISWMLVSKRGRDGLDVSPL